MFHRLRTAIAAALLVAVPTLSHAALTTYSQNFEGLLISSPTALSGDGWIVYGNVYTPALVYLYGYGPYPAPNGGSAFSDIDTGQGGTEQGAQQLSVYSDYNNLDHANGNIIESNVYREQTIVAADVGKTWKFQFDAKLGNLVAPSTALAFIKTLNPSAGWATTNFLTVETTAIPATWNTYTLTIAIDASLVGQILQIGFANKATGYVASGVFYDNIYWFEAPSTGVGDGRSALLELRPNAPNPFPHSTRLDFSLATEGPADVGVFDVVGRRVATLFHGTATAGPHSVVWNGRLSDGRLAPAGVYHGVLQTAAGRVTRRMVLAR